MSADPAQATYSIAWSQMAIVLTSCTVPGQTTSSIAWT
jgi:hypothetical protein